MRRCAVRITSRLDYPVVSGKYGLPVTAESLMTSPLALRLMVQEMCMSRDIARSQIFLLMQRSSTTHSDKKSGMPVMLARIASTLPQRLPLTTRAMFTLPGAAEALLARRAMIMPRLSTIQPGNNNGSPATMAQGDSYDGATAIDVDDSGNVYVTGSSTGSGTGSDYATIKYDSLGQEQWVARYNGPGNDADLATGIAIDGSGNVYVTGGSAGDYATVKYDSAGQQQWVARYNGP